MVVADDDIAICQVMAAQLSTELSGHVLLAGDGRRLLQLVAESSPSLVVIDAAMPDLDGLEALRRLRANARTAHLPVLVVSAVVDRQTALAAGADEYLSKPFDMDDFTRLARQLLSGVSVRGR